MTMALPRSHHSLPSFHNSTPAPPPPTLVEEFQALLQKLTDKDVETLQKLVGELDVKELKAAEKYIGQESDKRFKKRRVESQKRKQWGLLGRGRFDADRAKKEIDIELGDLAVPQCYEEIKRLLDIEKHPIYAKALGEWSRKESLFTSRVERKKTKVDNLKNEIYQLIGFFSVFQGVLLTAVSQSNLLHCNNWWSPIILSVVASVVTIFGVVQKLMQIQSFQKTIHSEEQSAKEVAARVNNLRNLGVEGFEFAKFEYRVDKKQSTRRFRVYFWLVIVSLAIFTVGFPVSHWRILCDSGSNPYAATVPASSQ
ncbi:hypothetical protein KC19_12G136500 [Ceratodon purpureus]|uniref:Uncharacterized protein n=1 Tax=Ceratodon purpureus TaxID=3225 RepID=A0A8T0GAZ0_CERPU|nr:hypothetical protein KC19_12G136500 [Ceratodon purpureus]